MVKNTQSTNVDQAQTEIGVSRVSTQKTFDTLKQDKDFERFLLFQVAVGQLSSEVEPTDDMKRTLVAKFNEWRKQGSPSPVMPRIDVSVKKAIAFYRIKSFGKQKMYSKLSGGTFDGLEFQAIEHENEVPVLDVDGNVLGMKHEKSGILTGDFIKNYTKDFKVTEAEKLIDDALEQSPDPSKVTYYVIADRKYIISKENFLRGDFDELIKRARKGEYLN